MGRAIRHAVLCLSAVIGAGFASGRELMSFFAQYGPTSWLGIVLSAFLMALMCYYLMTLAVRTGQGSIPPLCQQRLGKLAWIGSGAFSLLMIFTAGAMTAAGGELFSLLWPFSGGHPIGMEVTLGVALIGSLKGLKPLEMAGYLLLPGLIAMFLLGERLSPQPGAFLASSSILLPLPNGLAYAGMNMTLAAPVMMEAAAATNEKSRRHTSAVFGCLLLGLMALGNLVLIKHPHLICEPLPMVQLLRCYGGAGFLLCVIGLYLAVLSTLLAGIRGLYTAWKPFCKGWTLLLIAVTTLLTASGGFTQLVEYVYPLLGWGCLILLLLMGLPFEAQC